MPLTLPKDGFLMSEQGSANQVTNIENALQSSDDNHFGTYDVLRHSDSLADTTVEPYETT